MILGLIGCAKQSDWERANAQPLTNTENEGWREIAPQRKPRHWTGGVSAMTAERPGVPNAGLQLPRVSPDGKWIAFLDTNRRVSSESWVTGRGLDSVSLWIRRVEDEGLARNIALGHVAWPTWSSDSTTLFFVSHDPQTGCAIGLHDVASNHTKRLAVGIKKILTPTLSPDGRRVAVSGYGEVADQALLFVIDIETGGSIPGPPPALGGAQIMPHWIDNDTLIFAELDDGGGGLMRWDLNASHAEPIAPLRIPSSIFDAMHMHAGIFDPISIDQRFYAYYAPESDRIEWIDLHNGDHISLQSGDRAGAWWDKEWFLVAGGEKLSLVNIPEPNPQVRSVVSGEPPRMNLLPGRWVTLWTSSYEHSMLIAGPGASSDQFRLLQLWVITK
ncbi:MAG: hypothetical protein AAGH99_12595 [Planctomycetota bacterium]